MVKRWRGLLAGLVALGGCTGLFGPPQTIRHWAAYYDKALPAEDFSRYDLVVFDRQHYPEFTHIQRSTHVLAYITMGEVYDHAPEKQLLAEKGLILEKNSHWASHAVDLTSPIWQEMVLADVADAAQKGFDGVMLDTVDYPLVWAQLHAPERLSAMREAAIDLIHTIRKAHPSLKIMLNRGFSILPAVANDIDFTLAESIYTNTNVSTGQFGLFDVKEYAQVAAQLQQIVSLAPHLQILTLDYWNTDDVEGLERIYATQREHGFIPYVTTLDLRTHTPEPRPQRVIHH